jgi:peptide methionine sulfoxide reductase MsrA
MVRLGVSEAKMSVLDVFLDLETDIGTQYRSSIFYHTPEQKTIAESIIPEAQKNWKRKIMTEVVPAVVFWPAEEYHQKYLEKNPGGYWLVEADRFFAHRDLRVFPIPQTSNHYVRY